MTQKEADPVLATVIRNDPRLFRAFADLLFARLEAKFARQKERAGNEKGTKI